MDNRLRIWASTFSEIAIGYMVLAPLVDQSNELVIDHCSQKTVIVLIVILNSKGVGSSITQQKT